MTGPGVPDPAPARTGAAAEDRRTLVLLRHGQSTWNQENRFTGWTDVDLSVRGVEEALAAARFGAEQVHRWRRSYAERPPALDPSDPRSARGDPRYAALAPEEIPDCESLADTTARLMPYWAEAIVPALRSGQRVLVSAHGNSLRAIVKHMDGLSDEEIVGVEIPTGIPLVYELDGALRPVRRAYLVDPAPLPPPEMPAAGIVPHRS